MDNPLAVCQETTAGRPTAGPNAGRSSIDDQFLYSILAVFLNVGRMFFYLDMGAARSGRLSRGVGPPGLKTWKAGPGTLDGDPRRCTPRGT